MEVHGKNFDCPVTATLELIGGRWKAPILYYLSKGKRRFGQIHATIDGISRKVLTEQLKQLENDGLIIREYYKELPPRVDYSLTDFGKSLDVVFTSIVDWADINLVVDNKA